MMPDMQFVRSSVESVKSISQRTLASAWVRASTSGTPQLETFQPKSRSFDRSDLAVWLVSDTKDGGLQFRGAYQGSRVYKAFNENWEGRLMDDLIPPSLLAPALAGARACVTSRACVYMIYRTRGANGQRIDCERLLLPFASVPNGPVSRMMASMEVVSFEGNVDFSQVAQHFVQSHEIVHASFFSSEQPKHRSASTDARREVAELLA